MSHANENDGRYGRWLFARRNRGAQKAWVMWMRNDRPMSNEFAAGYHYGVLDAQRAAQGQERES